MVPPLYGLLFFFFFFLFSDHVLPLSSAAGACPSFFNCGNLGNLRFPFTTSQRKDCGMLPIHGCDEHNPNTNKTVQFNDGGEKLRVRNIDGLYNTVFVIDEDLRHLLVSGSCEAFCHKITVPPISALGYFWIKNNITVFKCNGTTKISPPKQFLDYTGCGVNRKTNEMIYFGTQSPEDSPAPLAACSRVQLPLNGLAFSRDPFAFIAAEFAVEVRPSDDCCHCFFFHGGQCRLDGKKKFYCLKSKAVSAWKLGLGIGLGVGAFILVLGLVLSLRRYKRKKAVSHVRLRPNNACPNDPDPDSGRLFFGVPIFSYKELQEATNNFHPSTKLGDGGFGTVYYGKLQDGREVAVKHLFNRNYKQVERFMTEVEILTRLRHRNLVSLYGCTSHQSRELLLVYEYIPNGTVASHLRGPSANPALLTWPIRIKIARETASALAYLHASGIIHRDVKTNNILLDNNFCVKVADFGLSRLFPNDVSHVSTAPQGTPGYLDPEYHFCFQLTTKSDVYSFGIVLMELISSMPAVDIKRDKDEITLGNLALRKIQRSEFEELVDPCLGIEKDSEVKRVVVAVGELAFQCLQRDKELRPSIDKVLEVLRKIESGKEEGEDAGDDGDGGRISENKANIHPRPVASLNRDQARLLKNLKSPSSPNGVTEKWESESTTPSVSV